MPHRNRLFILKNSISYGPDILSKLSNHQFVWNFTKIEVLPILKCDLTLTRVQADYCTIYQCLSVCVISLVYQFITPGLTEILGNFHKWDHHLRGIMDQLPKKYFLSSIARILWKATQKLCDTYFSYIFCCSPPLGKLGGKVKKKIFPINFFQGRHKNH